MTHRIATSALIVAALVVAGCAKNDESKRRESVRVAIGDCAGPLARFESGPRPERFDMEAFDQHMAALADDLESKKFRLAAIDEDLAEWARQQASEKSSEQAERAAAPDESDDHPSAMALDEGRMGKRDEGRMGKRDEGRMGRYRMKPGEDPLQGAGDEDSPRMSRKIALDRAREAGIIGILQPRDGEANPFSGSGLDDADVFGGLLADDIDGGGGFGSIGQRTADGLPSDQGRLRRRSTSGPTVRIKSPTVDGAIDKNIIRRHIRRQLDRIKYCYEKELLVRSGIGGKLVTTFVITASGKTKNVKARGVHENVESCVAQVIQKIQFPRPRGGSAVVVTFPFRFRLPGDAGDAGDEDSDEGGQEKTEKSAAGDSPTGETPAETAEPTPGDKDEAKDEAPPPRYAAGTKSPLGAVKDQLEECFRTARNDHGVLVVEMKPGDAGAVASAEIHGLPDKKTAECVARVARTARLDEPTRELHRCPLAFGAMPTGHGSTIDITADEIRFRSRRVARTRSILEDDSAQWKVVDLFERLGLQAERDRAAAGLLVIDVTGPYIIRPVAGTPMKVVHRVVQTVKASGLENWVLAAERQSPAASDWRVLRRGVELPVVPVPLGTGSPWSGAREKTFGSILGGVAKKTPRASVLVQDDAIWVGVSVINDFTRIAKVAGEHDWTALEEVLTRHKESSHLAGRTTVELAAEDAVRYKTLVAVIDVADHVGFIHWTLTPPSELSARPQL